MSSEARLFRHMFCELDNIINTYRYQWDEHKVLGMERVAELVSDTGMIVHILVEKERELSKIGTRNGDITYELSDEQKQLVCSTNMRALIDSVDKIIKKQILRTSKHRNHQHRRIGLLELVGSLSRQRQAIEAVWEQARVSLS